MTDLAIVNGSVLDTGRRTRGASAIAFADGRVAAIGDDDAVRRSLRGPHEVIDAHGALIVPGFVDAHVHLRAAASAKASIDLRGVTDAEDALRRIHAAAVAHPAGAWLSFANLDLAVPPSAERLTAAAAGRPVRLRHRSLHAWAFDLAALSRLGLAASGAWLPDHDGALGRLMGRVTDPALFETALAEWSRERLREGLVAVCDATPTNGENELRMLAEWHDRGVLAQTPSALVRDGALALRRQAVPVAGVKVLAAPGPNMHERMVGLLAGAWTGHRVAAVHCPDAETLGAALDAAGGLRRIDRRLRIEHASVCPPEWVSAVAALDATVVTHPAFLIAHGDRYLDDPALAPHEWLYRLASWRTAGVALAFGSDAPAGPASPLDALEAACARRTGKGRSIGPHEALRLDDALRALTSAAADAAALEGYGRLAVGGPAAAVLLSLRDGAPPAIAGVMAGKRWLG